MNEHIAGMLEKYLCRWPEEAEVVGRFADFVSRFSCFERKNPYGHVTGSAWVVNLAGTHVLLTHHRKLDRWLQLGGHADGNCDILSVARREVVEESGLVDFELVEDTIFDLDIHPIPARKSEPEHFHFDVRFAFRVTGSEDYVVSAESNDLAWVEIVDLASYTTEESMLRMGRKWLLHAQKS